MRLAIFASILLVVGCSKPEPVTIQSQLSEPPPGFKRDHGPWEVASSKVLRSEGTIQRLYSNGARYDINPGKPDTIFWIERRRFFFSNPKTGERINPTQPQAASDMIDWQVRLASAPFTR